MKPAPVTRKVISMSVVFTSRVTIDSKTTPGVQFTIRRMTDGVRNRLRLSLAKPLAQLRDLQARLNSFDVPENEKDAPAEMLTAILNLNDEIQNLVASEINPHYFRAAFVGVMGIEVDGEKNPSADFFIENGPEELYNEIVEAIRDQAQMSAKEKQNLESPTTSAADVVGGTDDTNAARA